MLKTVSKKFKRPTPSFLTSKSVHITTDLAMTGHRVLPSEDSEGHQHQSRGHPRWRLFLSFSVGFRRRQQRRATISCFVIRLTFRMFFGQRTRVVLDLPEPCTTCEGTGAKGGELKTAPPVLVKGKFGSAASGPLHPRIGSSLSGLGGRGKVPSAHAVPVMARAGDEIQHLRFNVPEGAEGGTRLRMRGKGEPAPRGVGEAGDLFIELEIEPHRWFERSGSDLIMSLPLGYADLLLGTTVELEHLDGKPLVIKVPAHSIR